MRRHEKSSLSFFIYSWLKRRELSWRVLYDISKKLRLKGSSGLCFSL